MKLSFSLIIVILTILHFKNANSENSLNLYLRKLILNFKLLIPNGDPDLDIPSMDPLRINNLEVKVNKPLVWLNLGLHRLSLNGLSNFRTAALDADINTLKIKVRLIFPELKISGKYVLDGLGMKFIPIYGKGNTTITVRNFEINTLIALSIDIETGALKLSQFEIKINYLKGRVYFENILGGGVLSRIVNSATNSILRPLFETKKIDFENRIRIIILRKLQNELKKVTVVDVVRYPFIKK